MSDPNEADAKVDAEVPGANAGTANASPAATAAAATAYQRADAETRAAMAILSDPSTDPRTARVHLVRGLRALAGVPQPPADADAEAVELPESWAVDSQALSRRLQTLVREAADEADTAPTAPAGDEPVPDAPIEVRRALLEHARAIVVGVRAAERALYGDRIERAARRRLWRGVGLVVLIAIPTITGLVLTMPSYREGPWRGQYFETKDFSGEPTIRRDNDIRFSWDRSGPLREFPEDAFSVRWDTCMWLDRDRTVAFRLTSDDGSRLFVDGERVINNWGVHGDRTRGKRTALQAGLHHVRVEFFDDKADAAITLVGSLDGERPVQLPVRVLHYPGDPFDEEDPCGGVRETLGQ